MGIKEKYDVVHEYIFKNPRLDQFEIVKDLDLSNEFLLNLYNEVHFEIGPSKLEYEYSRNPKTVLFINLAHKAINDKLKGEG